MKNHKHFFSSRLALAAIIFLSGLALQGCKEEISEVFPEAEIGPGLEASDIEVYAGEIGVAISTRSIARKGYLPVKAIVTISGSHFNATETIAIDELTQLVYFSRQLENLNEDEKVEMQTQGVDVEIQVLDESGQELGRYSDTQVLFSSTPRIEVQTTLADLRLHDIHIRPEIDHHVQIMNRQSKAVIYAVGSESASTSTQTTSLLYNLTGLNYEPGEKAFVHSRYRFTKVPGEADVYTIAVHRDGRVLYWYVTSDKQVGVQNFRNWAINGGETDAANLANYKFKIEAIEPGIYTLRSQLTNQLLTLNGVRLKADVANPDPNKIAYFRAINLEIQWEFNTVEYRQMQPVLPAARTEFAFNSTLINCSSGTLQQEVGREENKTTTLTSTWEESFSLSMSSEYTISTTSEAKVSAEYFGSGASFSQSVTSELSLGVSATSTQTEGGSSSSERTVTVSSKRTINVPSRKATLVSDMYQTYRNIKIPYIQRFRVRGEYPNGGGALTGGEILTQLNFNSFTGVVTEVGSDYVFLTVEGVNFIDEMIEAKTVADDLPADCD